MVLSHLEDLAGDDVEVSLATEASGPTGQMGVITAVYEREVGIPGMATIPLRHTLSVETPLSSF